MSFCFRRMGDNSQCILLDTASPPRNTPHEASGDSSKPRSQVSFRTTRESLPRHAHRLVERTATSCSNRVYSLVDSTHTQLLKISVNFYVFCCACAHDTAAPSNSWQQCSVNLPYPVSSPLLPSPHLHACRPIAVYTDVQISTGISRSRIFLRCVPARAIGFTLLSTVRKTTVALARRHRLIHHAQRS
jgi:hypothetical protein